MTVALRASFGALAGGVEHALALVTLAHATDTERADAQGRAMADDIAWHELDPDVRLVCLLQDIVGHSDYTVDDLRREGFADEVLEAVRSVRAITARPVPLGEPIKRYGRALRILHDSLH
jgi:hypothetical protein